MAGRALERGTWARASAVVVVVVVCRTRPSPCGATASTRTKKEIGRAAHDAETLWPLRYRPSGHTRADGIHRWTI